MATADRPEFPVPPRISVLVVTDNLEAFIQQALESVAAQRTNRVLEVVVADDASSDGTLEVVRHWATSSAMPVRILDPVGHVGAAKN